MTLPNTETGIPRPWGGEPTPRQLALARGHQWLAMPESGEVKSLREIARKEGVNSSYVTRMVNLTTLAPDIVAAILDETLPPDVAVFYFAVDPPLLWEASDGGSECIRPHNLDVLNQEGGFMGVALAKRWVARSHYPAARGGHYTSRAGDSSNGGITIRLTLKFPNTGCSVRVDS